MTPRRQTTLFEARLHCLSVVLTGFVCAALLTAAALVPAPEAVQPFVVVVCVGYAMTVAAGLPGSIAVLRSSAREKALADLRRQLDRLPETEHPLGL